MPLNFDLGDVVSMKVPLTHEMSAEYTITNITQGAHVTIIDKDHCSITVNKNRLNHVHKLFAVYYQHDYGSSQWIVKSRNFPTQDQIIKCLKLDFEPDRDEFISVEEIFTVETV